MTDRASTQSNNIVPPRRGAVLVQAVDATARPYNIGILPLGGKPICNAKQTDHVYLTLHAEGGDIYWYLDSATGSALADTTNNPAGTPLTATSMSDAMCARLSQGSYQEVRIERSVDTWIVLKTSTGTATLRLYVSSHAEV